MATTDQLHELYERPARAIDMGIGDLRDAPRVDHGTRHLLAQPGDAAALCGYARKSLDMEPEPYGWSDRLAAPCAACAAKAKAK
jgi:hypothetical protein